MGLIVRIKIDHVFKGTFVNWSCPLNKDSLNDDDIPFNVQDEWCYSVQDGWDV